MSVSVEVTIYCNQLGMFNLPFFPFWNVTILLLLGDVICWYGRQPSPAARDIYVSIDIQVSKHTAVIL